MAKKSPNKASKKKSSGKKPMAKPVAAKNKHIGSTVDSLLKEEGIKKSVETAAKVKAAALDKKDAKDVIKTANTVLKVAAVAAKHPDPKIKKLGGEVKKAGEALKAVAKPAPKPVAKSAEAPKAKLDASQPKPTVKKDDKEKEEKMATHVSKTRAALNAKIFGHS